MENDKQTDICENEVPTADENEQKDKFGNVLSIISIVLGVVGICVGTLAILGIILAIVGIFVFPKYRTRFIIGLIISIFATILVLTVFAVGFLLQIGVIGLTLPAIFY